MNIQLDPNHKMTSDRWNFIIREKRVQKSDTKKRKKGEIYWEAILFYPKLSQAIQGWSEYFLRSGETNSLESLEDAVRALYELLGDVKGVCCG
jgi:hypothetical protein